MRPPIILGPRKYKINILRSTSDLCRIHLRSKYCASKSRGRLPFRLCDLGLQIWIVSLCFRSMNDVSPKPRYLTFFFSISIVYFNPGQIQIKFLLSALANSTAACVKNKCIYQSNSIKHRECQSFKKITISIDSVFWTP